MSEGSEMKEVGTVRRRSEFDANPLKWELDGEVGVWDMCIVMGNLDKPPEDKAKALNAWEETRKKRGALLYKLQAVGIITTLKWSADRKKLYCLLSAKRERYELQAEIMGLEFELQPRYGGGFLPFVRSNKSVFLRAYNDEFFTMTQRQAILKDMINQSHFKGGASISIKKQIEQGVCAKWFPFHTESTRTYFKQAWATWKVWHWFRPQPLDNIQAYFGEELTLYFAWLGFYNFALIGPTIIGLIVFIGSLVEVVRHSTAQIGEVGFDGAGSRASNLSGWFNMIYAIIMMLWATLFLEFWKRYNATLSFKWNMLDFESSERSRPEYRGELELGVHTGGEWVPFDADDEALDQVHVVPTVNYDRRITKSKIAAAFVPLIMILAVVIIAVLAVLALRIFLQRSDAFGSYSPTVGGLIGSIIGAILIIVFNVLYGKLALVLNNWENHRTETEYQDALIFKTFLFQFVNTFASLYYIAFAKRATDFGELVGTRSLQDKCKQQFLDERGEYLQVINGDFFEALRWIPTYIRAENFIVNETLYNPRLYPKAPEDHTTDGIGELPDDTDPGVLVAFDTKTGLMWRHIVTNESWVDEFRVFEKLATVNDETLAAAAASMTTASPLAVTTTTTVANMTAAATAAMTAAATSAMANVSTAAATSAAMVMGTGTMMMMANGSVSINGQAFQFVNETHDDSFYEPVAERWVAFLKQQNRSTAQFFNASTGELIATQLNKEEVWSEAISTRIIGAGCISELIMQLATLMLVNIFVGQGKEVALPIIKVQVFKLLALFNLRKMDEEEKDDSALTAPWEVQAKLVPFAGTFDEYAEMVIQFALVTCFAAAFPLAPLLALFNNTVEVRTDAIKIVTTNNKPYYKGAQDIGGWYGILELIGYIAVVTNSLLIMLGFSVLPVAIHGGIDEAYPDQPPRDDLPLRCFIAAILIEHAMFVLKYAIAELVPDMPAEVRRQLARREFLKEELQSELDHRPHFRMPDEKEADKAADAFSYDTDSSYKNADGLGTVNEHGVVRALPLDKLLISADEANYEEVAATAETTDSKRAKKKRREEKKRRASKVDGEDDVDP